MISIVFISLLPLRLAVMSPTVHPWQYAYIYTPTHAPHLNSTTFHLPFSNQFSISLFLIQYKFIFSSNPLPLFFFPQSNPKNTKKQKKNKKKRGNFKLYVPSIMKEGRKRGKLSRCLEAPVRALAKVRDFYVSGMAELAGQLGGGGTGAMGFSPVTAATPALSISYRYIEDAGERARAAPSRTQMLGITKTGARLEPKQRKPSQRKPVQGRSFRVAIERIDEEEEEEESGFGKNEKAVAV